MSDDAGAMMFDATVRTEATMYVPGVVADVDATPECFRDFVDDLQGAAQKPLVAALPPLKKFANTDDDVEPWEVADALLNVPGFLVKAATPVREYHGDDGSSSYSWGHCYTAWLYAESESAIARVATAWARDMAAKDRTKSLADSQP